MVMKKKFETVLKNFFSMTLILLSLLFLLLYSREASSGALEGMKLCAEIIVPSLFPFMVLSSFTVKSGAANKIGKYFSFLTKFLFKLPGCTGSAIIISMIGGYPTGVKTVRALYEEKLISKSQTERMALFCVCSGPGFTITAVGGGMLNDVRSGIILFTSQVFAMLITGIILSAFMKEEKNYKVVKKEKNEGSAVFISSVSDSVVSIINMCGLIVLFSCVINVAVENGLMTFFSDLLEKMGTNKTIALSLPVCVLEITSGCKTACINHVPLEFISFALGFSGLCIHFQIFSVLKLEISKIKFLMVRILSAFISALSTYVILLFFPVDEQVFFSNTEKLVFHNSESYIGFICLIFMCIVFMLSLQGLKTRKGSKNV